MFPPELTVTASMYHLPTTGGSKQPYPGTADLIVSGAFLPMDRKAHALEGVRYTDPYEFYCPPTTDIRVGDKIVINSVNYFVKKTFLGTMSGIPHIRAAISRDSHA